MTIGVAVILAAIAGALHWKVRTPRLVAWLALLAGIGAASVLAGYLSAVTSLRFYGVGIFTLVALIGGIVFWEEAVKQNGQHRVRTPVVAVVLGVALAFLGGNLGAAVRSAGSGVGNTISHSVTTSTGGR
jgi:hypothetical protein